MYKLVRSQIFSHPKGGIIQTPLLLPSFSSRGVYKFFNNDRGKSSLRSFYKLMNRNLRCEHLVSAYDIHKHYIDIDDVPLSDYVVIDSGGFECLDFISRSKYWEKCFSATDYQLIMDSLPKQISANLVTFDKQYLGVPVSKQLSYAIPFADNVHEQNQLVTLLLKPSTSSIVSIGEIEKNVKELKCFDVIGVTERELGFTIEEKVTNIMKLRIILDENLINTPIHVFGCLEPMWIVLFYLAGAEIFDGLTWMSSCFRNEGVVRLQDTMLLDGLLNKSVSDEYMSLIDRNMESLDMLKSSLIEFFHTSDYTLFDGYNINYLDIINTMQKKVNYGW